MSVINDYLSGLKRQYPNTQAVNEQLEELRDTLHMKTEEYQAQGLGYNDAANAAIDSLGDITPLLDEVSGNVKNVYVSRLNRNNALLCSSIILGEFLLSWLVILIVTDYTNLTAPFLASMLALLMGIIVWPMIAWLNYRKNPNRISVVEMPFKKMLNMALIGWALISLFLFVINMITDLTVVWFQWPLIGVATWPINIYLYHRQLIGGRYDAA